MESADSPAPSFLRANWELLLLLAGGLSAALAVGLWLGPVRGWHRAQVRRELAWARQLYERNEPKDSLRRIPEIETSIWRLGEREAAEAYFLFGAIYNRSAEQSSQEEARGYYEAAAPHLREAVRLGAPDLVGSAVLQELGAGLFGMGDYVAAIEALEAAWQSLEKVEAPQPGDELRASRVLKLLADAHLRKPAPDYKAAAIAIANRIALPGLSNLERSGARRQQVELLLASGDGQGARRELQRLDADAQRSAAARFLLAKSYHDDGTRTSAVKAEEWQQRNPWARFYHDQLQRFLRPPAQPDGRAPGARGDWRHRLITWLDPTSVQQLLSRLAHQHAIELLVRALGDPELEDETELGRALIVLAGCYRAVGQYRRADETYERVINGFPSTDLVPAARFLRADALSKARDRRRLAAFRAAASAVKHSETYQNAYVPIEQVRGFFAGAAQQALEARDFPTAMELVKLFKPFSNDGAAEGLFADVARALALELEQQAAALPDDRAGKLLAEARARHREAGENFYAAAQAQIATLQYPDFLWQSALSQFHGQDFESAARVFAEFISVHGEAERNFLAHLFLARCHLALRRYQPAVETLESALVLHPRSPDRFHGRIQLALCYRELAGAEPQTPAETATSNRRDELYAKAEAVLRANVDGQNRDLEPTAREWRRSFFALGSLLYEMGRHDEAISTLSEAIRRYRDDPVASQAAYWIADAYLQSAKRLTERWSQERTVRSRALLEDQQRQRLLHARDAFERLADKLAGEQRRRELPPEDAGLFRDCYFRLGEVQTALEDWPRAIEAYERAVHRFQFRPDALHAYVQLAHAYTRLGRPAEARSTLRQARWSLERMDESAFAGAALSKQEWTDRLQALVGEP